MHIHEYQAKVLLSNYGITTPPYVVISTVEEVEGALAQLHTQNAVLKIQVHAGGRGQGGGVRLAYGIDAVKKDASELLGMRLVNRQTGEDGVVARVLLVTPIISYKKESYLAVTLDRTRGGVVLLASPAGGMDIEEAGASLLLKLLVPVGGKLRPYHKLLLTKKMGWIGTAAKEGIAIAESLIRAFLESDALLLEINPLVEEESGHLVALDAKCTLDDDALFRHPDYKGLFDGSQLPPTEALARSYDLSYISLDGNIGCMVNGAGLAMATMDIIQYHGGSPANFLDVGGGASEEKIANGFALLTGDRRVRAILVNIFGGIMNCATIARGLVAATQRDTVTQPLVVRMEGTSVEEGRAILKEAPVEIIIAHDLTDAAVKVVAAAAGGGD